MSDGALWARRKLTAVAGEKKSLDLFADFCHRDG